MLPLGCLRCSLGIRISSRASSLVRQFCFISKTHQTLRTLLSHVPLIREPITGLNKHLYSPIMLRTAFGYFLTYCCDLQTVQSSILYTNQSPKSTDSEYCRPTNQQPILIFFQTYIIQPITHTTVYISFTNKTVPHLFPVLLYKPLHIIMII